MESLIQIIEGIAFAAGRLIAADEIREAIRIVSGQETVSVSDDEIAEAVSALNERYERENSAIRIHEWADGYRMASIPAVANYLRAFFQEGPRKLTRSLMETLSIVAYRQPVSKPEIDNVRGVDSNYALRRLMELGFVSMAGRSDTVGRPLVFTTTARFLEEFGIRSLEDLPLLREADELFAEGELGAMHHEDLPAEVDPQDEEEFPVTDDPSETQS
ncbi:MAG: SMC-Scp complex subunit ScpB [Rhodothermales bacterium]